MAVRHLTTEEFADRLGVSVATARSWRKNGIGPAYLPVTSSATNGTIRYRLVDIEAWEESRIVRPGG
jgi:predicted site-specific integrase-resolvase